MENSRIRQIESFLKDSPDDPFLNYALAIEYIGIGDNATAENLFRDLLEKHPDYSATYYHYGKLLSGRNEKEKAIKIYETGIEVAGKNKELHAQAELRTALNELMYEED